LNFLFIALVKKKNEIKVRTSSQACCSMFLVVTKHTRHTKCQLTKIEEKFLNVCVTKPKT
jgi:hypothetical protein